MSETKQVGVLVAGDYVLDHHVYQGSRHHYGDRRHRGVQEVEELGGAALVHYLLCELGGGVVSYLSVAVDRFRLPRLPVGVQVPSELSAYAVWKPFGPEGDQSIEKQVWRTEDAMGFGNLPETAEVFRWPLADDLPKNPEVVVFSDGGMGFRDEPKSGEPTKWPPDSILDQTRWIVLKTTDPLGRGDLWNHLTQHKYRSKLVVIVSATDLRKGPAQISACLSWDATVESVLAALAPDGELPALVKCRHLLIAFGTEGGLWLDIGESLSDSPVHLVYDADAVEGEHRKPGRGTAFGALSCLTAAVAWNLARRDDKPDLEGALEGGLSAMDDLLDVGHGRATGAGAGFPATRLAKVICHATCRYARTVFAVRAPSTTSVCPAALPAPAPGVLCWSVMHEALRQQGHTCPEPAWTLAELIVRHGPIAIGSLPHLSIRNLMSADRQEIESLRVLRRLILDYKGRKECKKPLAIGVFGPPGAGKSFAVEEIAQTLVGKEEWMEFNLSQFKTGTEDLIGAFHQIRDRVLKNQVPVAFFDEFDSREYVWLQYLLAPMQDGAFQQGQITHPIGKCIFIFAGGTSRTFDSFGPPEKNTEAYTRFQMVKGPDFKSRLDGFLDILGPNRREIVSVKANGQEYERVPDPCDIFYPVRRAFVIRAEFGCQPSDRLVIDAGLLRGLLRVGSYIHGARSLSKVIEPFKTAYPGMIYRSLLPPRLQLKLHVDAEDFLARCEEAETGTVPGLVWDTTTRETVAVAIHEAWRALGIAEGRSDGGDFGKQTPFLQDSNRAAADRMVLVLSLVGLTLQSGTTDPAEREVLFPKIEYNLELLAEAEHNGWMGWHLDQGWQWGAEKDPVKKTHPCLKPYTQLSDEEQNKDRNSVRHYPDFAEKAGMKIVALT